MWRLCGMIPVRTSSRLSRSKAAAAASASGAATAWHALTEPCVHAHRHSRCVLLFSVGHLGVRHAESSRSCVNKPEFIVNATQTCMSRCSRWRCTLKLKFAGRSVQVVRLFRWLAGRPAIVDQGAPCSDEGQALAQTAVARLLVLFIGSYLHSHQHGHQCAKAAN